MTDFYYLYDPADNLALGQSIHLANIDGGMSYVVPFANKSGAVDPKDPASAGLGKVEAAIAKGPLKAGSSNDPIGNQLSPSELSGLIGDAKQWDAIKAMVKASIQQAPPKGWSEASLDAADSRYSIISDDAYPQLNSDDLNSSKPGQIFTAGTWKDADRVPGSTHTSNRGKPFIALGGRILDEVFVDYAGHYVPVPSAIGQSRISVSGIVNAGQMYKDRPGDIIFQTDAGDPALGLSVDANDKKVTIVNFSAISIGLGPQSKTSDDLTFTHNGNKASGTALQVFSGDVTFAGDFAIDQFVQVADGTTSLPAAVLISGKNSKVSFDKAKVYLGSI